MTLMNTSKNVPKHVDDVSLSPTQPTANRNQSYTQTHRRVTITTS